MFRTCELVQMQYLNVGVYRVWWWMYRDCDFDVGGGRSERGSNEHGKVLKHEHIDRMLSGITCEVRGLGMLE